MWAGALSLETWPPTSRKGRPVEILHDKNFRPDCNIQVSNNDTLSFLQSVPDDTFQLVVTSPPYNLGKPYERRQEFVDYLGWQKTVVNECVRVLRTGGSLCWEVGNYVDNGEVYPLDIFRSEEHTSELQSRGHLVCRLLLEKKN